MKQLSIQRGIFLAAMTYQAIQKFLNPDQFILPNGFTLVDTLNGGRFFPRIGYIAQSDKEIIVAFRGTENIYDNLMDLDILPVKFPFVPSGGSVVRGFLSIYSRIRFRLAEILQKLSSRKALFITGHSLGGALATMAALDIAINTKYNNPIVYTFASPRTGDQTFASAYNRAIKQSARIVNVLDLVPYLPPFFTHVQKRFPIFFNTSNPFRNHEMAHYFNAVCRFHPLFCRRLCTKNPVNFCPLSQNRMKKKHVKRR
ncbi:lipase family protein [Ammoniphilus sp. 3BR4]|uniref:lipase family protein n=1 Tax=Ammoniphilus sp. 3BR4 TaxID=3158265 RepID=UPI0034655AB5